MQQFVLDWKGEFASLHERLAYVLAGPDGDVPADPRTAGLLCRGLLELGASAVLDLSELRPEDRQHFDHAFLHELMQDSCLAAIAPLGARGDHSRLRDSVLPRLSDAPRVCGARW